jgi:hypothetical protein
MDRRLLLRINFAGKNATYLSLYQVPDMFALSEASLEFFGKFHKNPQYQISRKSVRWKPR